MSVEAAAQGVSTLRRWPPSTSGLGHHPFKVAARVRIPLGAWAVSSAGRAPALHAGGRRFESCTAHYFQSLRQRLDNQAKLGRSARRTRGQYKALIADGVGHVEVLGRDHSASRNPVGICAPQVGDLNPVTALKALEEIERPGVRRSMSCYCDRVSAAWSSSDRPPRGPAVEP